MQARIFEDRKADSEGGNHIKTVPEVHIAVIESQLLNNKSSSSSLISRCFLGGSLETYRLFLIPS
jgi:hypothetical protein